MCVCARVEAYVHMSNIYIYYLSAYGAGKDANTPASQAFTLSIQKVIDCTKLNHIFWHVADEYFMNSGFFSFIFAAVSAAPTEKLPRVEVIKSVRRGSRTTQRRS